MSLTKHSAIDELFKAGWEQKDIARVLKLSEVTVSRYAGKNGLRKKRAMQSLARQTSEENALIALEHQSTIIRLISEKLREKLTETATMEELQAALIPKGEIDALQKLFTTIKGKELEWSAVVKIIREFTSYLKESDTKLAQQIIDHADDYINEKRRVMQ
jgi:predicted transcriptional regulator